ncbi:HAMP domain-containing histidine kinase [Solihabitans fulvus]|uniref:histidine kinase n=1 Tax=Solihabitans fulvus TaxID=1892852 RepID=A0A5B2XKH3_9PSEU|nr:HAMP domain-containing histidine kinase [Solihabitans fulvus]
MARLRTVSLRRRVTLAAIGVLCVVLIAVLIVVDALFTAESRKDQNAILADRVAIAQQLARNVNVTPENYIKDLNSRGIQAQVVTKAGAVFGAVPEKVDGLSERQVKLTTPNNKLLNGATVTLSADTRVLAAAQIRLRRLLVLVGFAALALTAVVLVGVVRYALSPLDAMTRLARSIASGHRGNRLSPARTDTELGRTAAAFDDMLDALEGAETQARQAEAASKMSEERTRRFVADAAHELRTPIAGVQAIAEATVQAGPEVDPEERERMHLLLVREARRAGRLVDDLLALARIDAGIDVNREPVDLLALARAEVERTRLLAADFDIDVDEASVPVLVLGDPQRLAQVLANLVNNARQAAGSSGRVRLRSGLTPAHQAELVVADNGPGVPAADRDRIFDRLVRLDVSRGQNSGGSGLGLAIARGFVRAHGGELRCVAPPEDEPGAVFQLVLPVVDQPTVPFSTVSPPPYPAG